MRLTLALPLLLAGCAAAPLSNPGTTADIEIGTTPAGEPASDAASLLSAPDEAAAPEGDPAPDAPSEAAAEPPRSGGLFGFLSAPPRDTQDDGQVQTAAAAAPRGGLFGGGGARSDAAPPGTALPFGQVARVCSASKRELGTEVDRVGKWKLHDTVPNSASPRVMYVTGFDDRCAQMFTAALALFGSATAHETVRYTRSGAYTETDEAYEKIKGRICGVRRGSPCPADRIDKLESQVAFVTAYPGFGATGGPWLEILLHKGDMVAAGLSQR